MFLGACDAMDSLPNVKTVKLGCTVGLTVPMTVVHEITYVLVLAESVNTKSTDQQN